METARQMAKRSPKRFNRGEDGCVRRAVELFVSEVHRVQAAKGGHVVILKAAGHPKRPKFGVTGKLCEVVRTVFFANKGRQRPNGRDHHRGRPGHARPERQLTPTRNVRAERGQAKVPDSCTQNVGMRARRGKIGDGMDFNGTVICLKHQSVRRLDTHPRPHWDGAGDDTPAVHIRGVANDAAAPRRRNDDPRSRGRHLRFVVRARVGCSVRPGTDGMIQMEAGRLGRHRHVVLPCRTAAPSPGAVRTSGARWYLDGAPPSGNVPMAVSVAR